MTAALLRVGRTLLDTRAVLERDFLSFTSRKRFLALRVLVVALAAALVATLLGDTALGAVTVKQAGRVGVRVFQVCLATMPATIVVLSPVLASTSIASERSLRTLPLVLAAPGSATSFVLAKFLSRLGATLVLVYALIPVTAVSLIYGGVSLARMLDLAALCTGMAIVGAVAGTVASAFARTVVEAVRFAALLGILLPIAVAVVELIRQIGANPGARGPDFSNLGWNPFGAWGQTAVAAEAGAVSTGGVTLLAWSVAWAVVGLAAASFRLSRETWYESIDRRRRRVVRPFRLADPVYERALRGTFLSRPGRSAWLRLALVTGVVGGIVAFGIAARELDDRGMWLFAMIATTVLLVFLALTQCAHGIASERQEGSLEMLLATPLSASAIVRGKARACILGVLPLGLPALIAGLVGTGMSELPLRGVIVWVAATVASVFVAAAVGSWVSARARTAGNAAVGALALVLGVTLLHGLLMTFIFEVARARESDWIWLICASPGAVVGALPAIAADPSLSPKDRSTLIASAAWAAAYVLLGLRLLHTATRRIERGNDR